MKVGELIKKVHLYKGQGITLIDHSTATTFKTCGRYTFDKDSDEIERLMKLKVNTFDVNEDGLRIYAE